MAFRWGILGTGAIAAQFAEGLAHAEDAELAAVGSRARASADRFGDTWNVPRRHASYEALARDPDVDAVYVSSPHSAHMENTLLCIEHGKAVLCEKPFAINAGEARRMVHAARERGTFLMEAMWMRFNPVMVRLHALLAEDAIGEVHILACDFGFRAPYDPKGRLFAPALGGGALLDVGVYCVHLAHAVFGGPPEDQVGFAHLGATGIDEQSAWVLRHSGGGLAVMAASVRTNTSQQATLFGTRGRIRVPDFWHPDRLFLDDAEERFEVVGNGYHYEADEVARCVRAGELESDVLPLARTIEVMETLDRLRAEWGLRYPME